MNASHRTPMSLAAFLAWEERQEQRYEFDGSQPVALADGSTVHAALLTNLASSVGRRLRGRHEGFFGGNRRVRTGATIRYPDGLVTSTTNPSASANPVVIFEVVSAVTSSTDHTAKNSEFAAMHTVQRYVMLEDELVGATVFARTSAGWTGRLLTNGAVLALPEIGIEMPLAEIYDGPGITSCGASSSGRT